jgi:hypothetical protein
MLGEVYNGDPKQLAPYQDHMEGLLDYARYVLADVVFMGK